MNNILKSDKYLIVDPGYVYPKEEWSDFCDKLWSDGGDCVEMKYKRSKFLVIQTKWGDGSFPLYENDRKIGELSVDAGLLSVIPLELAKSWGKFDENSKHWKVVDLKEDSVFSSGGGNFEFGPFKVITDVTDEEENECPCCGYDCGCRY